MDLTNFVMGFAGASAAPASEKLRIATVSSLTGSPVMALVTGRVMGESARPIVPATTDSTPAPAPAPAPAPTPDALQAAKDAAIAAQAAATQAEIAAAKAQEILKAAQELLARVQDTTKK